MRVSAKENLRWEDVYRSAGVGHQVKKQYTRVNNKYAKKGINNPERKLINIYTSAKIGALRAHHFFLMGCVKRRSYVLMHV